MPVCANTGRALSPEPLGGVLGLLARPVARNASRVLL
jgi:hypothetical protein